MVQAVVVLAAVLLGHYNSLRHVLVVGELAGAGLTRGRATGRTLAQFGGIFGPLRD
ncbi:MAG TPA: hypothetical protein VMV12_04460 [Candidatus Micrarchaeaceae archaeon]|nr:hypothetical protein [Candidatus Micrarchaeaceae archaeon]